MRTNVHVHVHVCVCSCDLMCEDDSDDFVHVETPSDVQIGSEDTPSLPYSGDRPRRFLRHIRRQNSPRDKLEKSWTMHEISGERVQQIEVHNYAF